MFHLAAKKSDIVESVYYYSRDNSWDVWKKPPGTNFVYIILIGGGGGGGGGAGAGGGANASGGAGGASSSITKAILPAFLIPEHLYVFVGAGGTGGAGGISGAGSSGSSGGFSLLSVEPNSSSTLSVLMSSGNYTATGAGGGGGGTVGGTSTGGSIGSVFSATQGILSDAFMWQAIAGRPGYGGLAATLNNVDPKLTPCSIVLPGAPGGYYNGGNFSAGSGILSHSFTPAVSGGATLGGGGANGQSFLMNEQYPMYFTSGTGGGSNSTTGGGGGNGSYGCGGGGGGVGAVGGAGGKGGDGLVIITAW